MRRFVLIVALVAGLLGLVDVGAKTGESSPSEAVTGAGPAMGTAPVTAPAMPRDGNLATDATAGDPQEPSPVYWAENRPPAGTDRSLPTRLFPADNWWNLSISAAPVDAKSPTYIAALAAARLTYDWGNNYGIPYVTVSGDYPKIRFQGGYYWKGSDDVEYPVPIPALTELGWTQDLAGTISNPVWKGDRHLLIVDVDNQYLLRNLSTVLQRHTQPDVDG